MGGGGGFVSGVGAIGRGFNLPQVNRSTEIKGLNPNLIKDKWLREENLLLGLGDGNELLVSLTKPDANTKRTTNAFCPVLLTIAFKDKNGNFVFDKERDLPLYCWLQMPRSITLHQLQFEMGLAQDTARILAQYSSEVKHKPTNDEITDHVIQELKGLYYNEDTADFRVTDIAQELENSWPPKS